MGVDACASACQSFSFSLLEQARVQRSTREKTARRAAGPSHIAGGMADGRVGHVEAAACVLFKARLDDAAPCMEGESVRAYGEQAIGRAQQLANVRLVCAELRVPLEVVGRERDDNALCERVGNAACKRLSEGGS